MLDNKVPTTVEEVKDKFRSMYSHQGTIDCMIGIFTCRMAQGESVLQAYENTLKDYLRIFNEKETK